MYDYRRCNSYRIGVIMAFEAISLMGQVTSKYVEVLGDLTNDMTTIGTACSELTSLNTTPPAGLFSFRNMSINPTFTMPSVAFNISPIDTDMSQFEISLDTCHLDTLVGTMLYALQQALSSIVSGIISQIQSAISQIVNAFEIVSEGISEIWEWLKEQKKNLWDAVRNTYNDIYNCYKDCKEQVTAETTDEKRSEAKIKTSLWSRAMTWFESLMETIGGKMDAIETATVNLINHFEDAAELISSLVKGFAGSIADLAKDINCLTKASTLVLA